jgi:pyruvate dehydrogenase E2 component (dihydrolipoamide acetyltransferase)
MLYALTVPKWGLTMERAAVLSWFVEEGNQIEVGQPLVEIESEKIANELQSEFTGVLRRILAPVGSHVAIGEPLAVVANERESDADIDAYIQTLKTTAASTVAEDTGPKRERVRVAHHDISYLAFGGEQRGKVPALLVHGFGGDAATWQMNAAAIAAHRQVYALDLPGHGFSSRELDSGSVEELADALSGFATALSLYRFHLVAHSLGAAIAMRVAARQPETIASLTLLSPAGLGSPVDPVFIAKFARASSRKEVKGVLEQLFEDRGLITAELIEKVQQGRRLDGATQALGKIAAASFDARGGAIPGGPVGLTKVESRTLVIVGDRDRVIRFDQAMRELSALRIEFLSGSGHMPQIEAFQPVNALLQAAFDAHDADVSS